jgi:enamine deaminase RidA (YjgF/YER057c/UK114 family)
MKRTITVERGAKPAGSYSCATVPNDCVFASEQGPFDSKTNSAPGAFTDQMRQTLENSSVAPEAAGTGIGELAKVNAISRVSCDSPTPTKFTGSSCQAIRHLEQCGLWVC